MEEHVPATILIVEDDTDIAEMLNAYFRVQGYQVFTVNWGEDGIRACIENPPDVVILDIRLPDMDGFEVAEKLKSNRRTQMIPIIFLTEKRQREDKLRGLSLHAEDYITKPFDIQELRLRVRNVLLRHKRGSLTHPVTALPERQLCIETLENRLASGTFGLAVLSIKNMDAFREVYGFVASDDLLRAVVMMLQDSLVKLCGDNGYLAQWSSADFILLTQAENCDGLVNHIRQRLEKSFDYFYNERDRESGRFQHQLGVRMQFSLIDPKVENLQKVINDLDHLIRQV